MSISEFTSQAQTLVQHFSRAISRGDAALFVGAGFSMNAEYLDATGDKFELWTSLIHRACEELGEDPKSFTKWYTYPEVLEFYRQEFRDNALIQLIHKGVPDRNSRPGRMHIQLLDPRKFAWSALITTNIDTLLERTLECLRVPYKRLAKKEDFAGGAGLEVVKLHGTHDDPKTYVFTENEYNGIDGKKPLLTAKVRQVYADKSCLFVGYSLRDPDFRRVVQTVRDLTGADLRLSIAIIPNIGKHEKTYWRNHGVRILSCGDLADGGKSMSPAKFTQIAIDALEETILADNSCSLSQLNRITRLFRMRKLSPFPPSSGPDDEDPDGDFWDSYIARRELAKSKLFFDYFPREALRVLIESCGDDRDRTLSRLFAGVESTDLGKEPPARRYAIETLCSDLAETLVHDLKLFGIPPDIPQETIAAVSNCAARLELHETQAKLRLALDILNFDPRLDGPVPEAPYGRSSDRFVRTLPRYLNILRLAEVGRRKDAKDALLSVADDIRLVNPLWYALIMFICGDVELAQKTARGVLSASHRHSIHTNVLAAQFIRDTNVIPELEADMYLETSHFMFLARENGISTEDLDFERVREREIGIMLEISTRASSTRAKGESTAETATPVLRRLLMRHRVLGIPYKFYQREVLGHWLQSEFDGPQPVNAIIEYGSGAPTDCISKTDFGLRYRRTDFLSVDDWIKVQGHAMERLIQSMGYSGLRSPKNFWGKMISVMMPYLTMENFGRLLEEANAGYLGLFFVDWRTPGVGSDILSHDKEVAIRYLATRRGLDRDTREIGRILRHLSASDVSASARDYVRSLISEVSSFVELVSFAYFFAGEPEAFEVVEFAKSARFFETQSSGLPGHSAGYRQLDSAYVNYIRSRSGVEVGDALIAAHDSIRKILADGGSSLGVSSSGLNLLALAAQDVIRDEDVTLFKEVILKLEELEDDALGHVDDNLYQALLGYAIKTEDFDGWVSVVRNGGISYPNGASVSFLRSFLAERGTAALCEVLDEGIESVGVRVGVVNLMFQSLRAMIEGSLHLDPCFAATLRMLLSLAIGSHNDVWLWLIPELAEVERNEGISSSDLDRLDRVLSQCNVDIRIPTRRLATEIETRIAPRAGGVGVFGDAGSRLLSNAVERKIIQA